MRDPVLQKRLHDGVRRRVCNRDRFRPAGSAIDDRKEVFEASVGGEGAHDVDVDVREPFMSHRDREDGRHHVSCDLARRACLALPGPKEDVVTHAVPGVGLGDDGQGYLPGRMGEIVYRMEDGASSNCGDQDPRVPKQSVAHNQAVDAREADVCEPE